jgi:radical SAM protein with 4Fe4S-binding SPASM domain
VDCVTYPEIDLGEWGEELHEKLQGRRYPLGGTLELTERCNLRCVHCYINQKAGSDQVRGRELNTEQTKDIVDRMAEAGCMFLLLTGGEPLLRSDFSEIYTHARRKGILVNLFTNAALVTPRLADLLADFGVQAIDISIYGATQETYEAVTQVPGSYGRTFKGIDLLMERGLPVSLKTIVLKTNRSELAAMRGLAEQLGVQFRYDGLIWPRVDGGKQVWDHRLSVQELIALDDEDEKRQEEWRQVAEQFEGQLVRNEYVYSCGAGLRSFHIDSTGKMSICTMSRVPDFDLLKMSFEAAWEELGKLRQEKRKLDTACLTCTANGLCMQCPGWSQAVHGDHETPVEYVCELGKIREIIYKKMN